MARRFRPLGPDHIAALPCECAGCVFWETTALLPVTCGAACDEDMLRDWYDSVSAEWGGCGRVAMEDDEVLGFIKYAPPRFFPQSRHIGAGAPDDDVPLIACLHIRDDARRLGLGTLLLRGALHDLSSRGEKHVQAYARAVRHDMSNEPVVGVEFLLRNGFIVDKPHPQYPLLRVDLRTLVKLSENIEAALEALRLPLRRQTRVPSPSIKAQGRRS